MPAARRARATVGRAPLDIDQVRQRCERQLRCTFRQLGEATLLRGYVIQVTEHLT
jgi:hypothetical protein